MSTSFNHVKECHKPKKEEPLWLAPLLNRLDICEDAVLFSIFIIIIIID